MIQRIWNYFGIAALSVLPSHALAAEQPRFEWKDGDRVVLIGDTLIERDQKYGYLETLITAQNPDKSITFRNLGWSGDTALGLSRARFGPPREGFDHLRDHVLALKPTVLIVGYGMAESFGGDAGLTRFVSDLNTILDSFASTKARIILLSPIAHEDLGRPLPDPARHNESLAKYRDAIRKLAEDRNAWFIDLFGPTISAHDYGIDPLTENGIHPSAYGHWYFASVIDMDLRKVKKEPSWDVRIDLRGEKPGEKVSRTKLKVTEASRERVRFQTKDATLPTTLPAEGSPEAVVWLGSKRVTRVAGLAPGRFSLSIDGKVAATADAGNWAKGVPIEIGPEFDQTEALRTAINAKNLLYFYRWRPQNETYLFGFRKHEQGNNAREIPLFDPLVEAKEAEIARLRMPVEHAYELRKVTESEVSR